MDQKASGDCWFWSRAVFYWSKASVIIKVGAALFDLICARWMEIGHCWCLHFCWRNVWGIWGYVHSVIHLSWRHFCFVLCCQSSCILSSIAAEILLMEYCDWMKTSVEDVFFETLTLRRQDVWYSFFRPQLIYALFDICLVWNFLCSAKVEFSAVSCLALRITCGKVHFTLSLLCLYSVFTLLSSEICCRRILV